MARIWKELATGARYDHPPLPTSGGAATRLQPDELICVHVCSFTFRFTDADEIREYIAFFENASRPHGPASLIRWRPQPWYEPLPPYLLEEPKREKVLKALREALDMAETDRR
jgi:hypothetical protein